MSRNRIEDFGPYQDAVRLFDHVVEDMQILRDDTRCYRLIGQQVGSADSICANMDEGYGRLSRTEFIRFLDIARGSARETLGRYKRLKHWLSAEAIDARVLLADKIIAQLTTTIHTLRANNVAAVARHATSNADPSPRATPAVPGVHELAAAYGTQATPDPDVLVRDEIEQLLALTHSENTP
jgi:four helix bundle protein